VEDARAALDFLRGRYPELPYALAGFSFGARVILRLGCSLGEPRPERLIAAGLPISAGHFDYFKDCTVPRYFVQSTQDEYGPKEVLETAFQTFAEPKRLDFIEAQNHFFSGALPALEDLIAALPR
jgi:uncharacterized protein